MMSSYQSSISSFQESEQQEKLLPSQVLYLDIRKFYQIQEVIGVGEYGKVRRATQHQQSFAVKSIPIDLLAAQDAELQILFQVKHSNIIQFHAAFVDSKHVHLVMELLQTNLQEVLLRMGRLGTARVKTIIRQVLEGLVYLHGLQICHRDLKLENIMFKGQERDNKIKLIDFGLSKQGDALKTKLGTPYYVAPEVLTGTYSQKCDVWSVGVVTYMLLTGEPPFTGETMSQLFSQISKGKLNQTSQAYRSLDPTARHFVLSCLITDPDHRFSAEEALQHAFMIK